jgi:hypothetical protein
MAATVEICESNGTTPTITHNVTNLNMGSTDAANLDPVANPIVPGANSFEKWVRFHVTDMGGSSKIDNLKIWGEALAAEAAHKTNCRTSSYDGAQTFPTGAGEGPKATDRSATYDYTQTMPTSEPASANLGIGGALAGALTDVGYSDYEVSQIQTTVSAVAGNTTDRSFQFDETA